MLEVGCGTGQLTRSLVARGLRVTAVEPGGRLIALADANLDGEVKFVNARLEDATLAPRAYVAAFSASAFHWIDPDVSWRRVAESLVPGGTFALISHFALREEATARDGEMALEAIRRAAPDIAAGWPVHRDLDATLEGVEQRAENLSEVWAWLGNYDLARPYAGNLFGDVRIDAIPIRQEHTAEEMNAMLRTTSLSSRLSPEQFDVLEHPRTSSCAVGWAGRSARARCGGRRDRPAGAATEPVAARTSAVVRPTHRLVNLAQASGLDFVDEAADRVLTRDERDALIPLIRRIDWRTSVSRSENASAVGQASTGARTRGGMRRPRRRRPAPSPRARAR